MMLSSAVVSRMSGILLLAAAALSSATEPPPIRKTCNKSCSIELASYGEDEAPTLTVVGKKMQRLTSISVQLSTGLPSDHGIQQQLGSQLAPAWQSGLQWTPCTRPGQFQQAKFQLGLTEPALIEDNSWGLHARLDKENVTLRAGVNVWWAGGSVFSYRRVPAAAASTGGSKSPPRALVIRSDSVPAQACLSNQCWDYGGRYLNNCEDFTGCVQLKLTKQEAFLYVRLEAPASTSEYKQLEITYSVGNTSDSCDAQRRPATGRKSQKTVDGIPGQAGASAPKKIAQSNPQQSNRLQSNPQQSNRLQSNPPRPAHHAVKDLTHSGPGAADAAKTHSSSVDGGTQTQHNTNTASADGNVVHFNLMLGSDNVVGAESRAPAARQFEPAPEDVVTPLHEQPAPQSVARQAAPREEAAAQGNQVQCKVSRTTPATLQLRTPPPRDQEASLLRLEVNATGRVDVLLGEPSSDILRISSKQGGTAWRQVCPAQLRHGVLRATVSTDADTAVTVSARLTSVSSLLRLGERTELTVTPRRPALTPLRFPDWTSPVALKADLGPGRCLLLSVLRRACGVGDGARPIFKYVSGSDRLYIQRELFANRTAYLRAEWAPPARCGLPPAASAAGVTRALLTLVEAAEGGGWAAALLPALSAALLLPTLVAAAVRAATNRLLRRRRRGDDGDNDGVLIEEMLPAPQPAIAAGPASAIAAGPAPAIAAGPAPAAAAVPASNTVLQEAGYPDISSEKHQPAYPDLAQLERQLADQLKVAGPEVEAALRSVIASGVERALKKVSASQPEASVKGVEVETAAAPAPGGDGSAPGETKDELVARMGLGGDGGPASAPDYHSEPEPSSALLQRAARPLQPVSPAAPLLQQQLSLQQQQVQQTSGRAVLCWSAPVLAASLYDVIPPLQLLEAGDAGACAVGGLGPWAGLVLLVPAVAFSVTIALVRRHWRRVTSSAQGAVAAGWPLPAAEWLLLAGGVQAAVASLCPGSLRLLTANLWPVALLSVLTRWQLPSGGRWAALALPSAVASAALASARDWLPTPLDRVALTATGVLQLIIAGRAHLAAALPNNPVLVQVRAALTLLPRYTLVVVLGNVATVAVGTMLSADGCLGLFAAFNATVLLMLSVSAKGRCSPVWPCYGYWAPSLLTGGGAFLMAVVLHELQHFRLLAADGTSATGPLLYLISMLLVAVGTPPRVLVGAVSTGRLPGRALCPKYSA